MHESGSSQKARSARSDPTAIQRAATSRSARSSGGRASSAAQPHTASTNAAATGVSAMTVTARFPKRRCRTAPPTPFTTAPTSGNSGIQRRNVTALGSMAQ